MQFNDISDLEESIVSNIDSYIKNPGFISLPDQIIHRIVLKSQEKSSSIQVFHLVSNLAKDNRQISQLFNLIDNRTLGSEQRHELNQIVFSFLFDNAILPQNVKNMIELSDNVENESLKVDNQILAQANEALTQELEQSNKEIESLTESLNSNEEKLDELLLKLEADKEKKSKLKKQRNYYFEQLAQIHSSDLNFIAENLITASSNGDIDIVIILHNINNFPFFARTFNWIGMALKAAIKENQIEIVNFLISSNLTEKYNYVS